MNKKIITILSILCFFGLEKIRAVEENSPFPTEWVSVEIKMPTDVWGEYELRMKDGSTTLAAWYKPLNQFASSTECRHPDVMEPDSAQNIIKTEEVEQWRQVGEVALAWRPRLPTKEELAEREMAEELSSQYVEPPQSPFKPEQMMRVLRKEGY